MTDLPDWAQEKAREWLHGHGQCHVSFIHWAIEDSPRQEDSLAALLVEVGNQRAAETLVRCCICEDVTAPHPDCECVICHRQRVLAEVRRVVEEQFGKWESHSVAPIALRDVLARLDALK